MNALPPNPLLERPALTLESVRAIAATYKIRVQTSDRAGCFDLYWPDGAHCFAVSLRDVVNHIARNQTLWIEADKQWRAAVAANKTVLGCLDWCELQAKRLESQFPGLSDSTLPAPILRAVCDRW